MPKKEIIRVNLAAANPNLSPAIRSGKARAAHISMTSGGGFCHEGSGVAGRGKGCL